MPLQADKTDENPYQAPQADISLRADKKTYEGKVYGPLHVSIAILFGSVLAGGLLLHSNFVKFRCNISAITTLIVTTLATTLFMFASMFVNYPSSLLYLMFNFILAVFALPLTRFLQGDHLDAHEYQDKLFHSSFRAAGIGLACLVAMAIMMQIAFYMFMILKL